MIQRNLKKSKYVYEDTSNKLFSKLSLANKLSERDIGRLNDFYKRNGLFIKQVKVDNFGNEIYNENEINIANKNKRSKRAMMTLKQFYDKYYNYYPTKKNSRKFLQKKKKRAKNEINDSFSDLHEESSVDEDYLKNLKNNLRDIYNDIQNIEYKDCKITDFNFKSKVINYLSKFKNYLSNAQYLKLLNKWKDELIAIKGVNPLDQDSLEDLSTWRMSILKGFKSEVVLIAMANLLSKKLGEEEANKEEEKEENKSEDKKKVEDDDNENSESSESVSDIDSFNNRNINHEMEENEGENENEIGEKIQKNGNLGKIIDDF